MTASVDMFALYRRATRSVFRLEARPDYNVAAESAQLRAFERGEPLPHDPQVQRSMDLIRSVVAGGTRVHRVHVLDLPLTPYLRYELRAYEENVAAGEDVRVADRSWHKDLAALTEDFVLFDGDTDNPAVAWMRYDDQGRVTGLDYSQDAADLARACADRDRAMEHAVSLDTFATAVGVG